MGYQYFTNALSEMWSDNFLWCSSIYQFILVFVLVCGMRSRGTVRTEPEKVDFLTNFLIFLINISKKFTIFLTLRKKPHLNILLSSYFFECANIDSKQLTLWLLGVVTKYLKSIVTTTMSQNPCCFCQLVDFFIENACKESKFYISFAVLV